VHRVVIAAGEVTAQRPLNLHHPRAEVGELPGRVWRRDCLLEAYDGDASQGRIGQWANSSN